jgi:hypothetical protein
MGHSEAGKALNAPYFLSQKRQKPLFFQKKRKNDFVIEKK